MIAVEQERPSDENNFLIRHLRKHWKKRMSKAVIIENPVLNSPFEEPSKHFKFTEDGITNEVVEQRR